MARGFCGGNRGDDRCAACPGCGKPIRVACDDAEPSPAGLERRVSTTRRGRRKKRRVELGRVRSSQCKEICGAIRRGPGWEPQWITLIAVGLCGLRAW